MVAGMFAQCLPQGRHVNREVVLLDYRVDPDAAHQLILVDWASVLLNEHGENVERLGAQGYHVSVPQEKALADVEAETIELVEHLGRFRAGAMILSLLAGDPGHLRW
jgi:hypothetical protein